MPDPKLTAARNALWADIEGYSTLENVFKRKYKFDDDDSPEINPTADQLPAIAIYPAPGFARMVTNRAYDHKYKLMILVFTRTWNLQTADQYAEEIVESAWQSAGQVKTVTGFYPENEFSLDYDRIKVDSQKSTLISIGLTLKVRFDPQG